MRVLINAQGVDGPYSRDGFFVVGTNGCFGYFLDPNDLLYHLTHLPSGRSVVPLATEEDAISVAFVVYEAMGANAASPEMAVAVRFIPSDVRVLLRALQNVTHRMGAKTSR